jgi:hypothetical protein
MRITREILLKLARDTAAERVRLNRRIVCIYLTGSLLRDEPLLGGTADIDLFIIHDGQPPAEREMVRLSDEVHLDLAHLSQEFFRQPRSLRIDPWVGPFIVNHPLVLHDTRHWFEFTQASITAQFNEPGNVIQRAAAFAGAARRAWGELQGGQPATAAETCRYLQALGDAANALVTLGGTPLALRRFLLEFPQRMLALGSPELSAALLELLPLVDDETWQSWQPLWKAALQEAAAQPDVPSLIAAPRHAYYMRAALALFPEHPAAAQWIALVTWSQALCALPAGSPHLAPWQAALQPLSLDPAGLPSRLPALDTYLDSVEEALDVWGRRSGV